LVGSLIEFQLHGTIPQALVAAHAVFLDEFHPDDADFVEEGVNGAKGTDGSAKGAPGEDHEHGQNDEDGEFVVKKDTDKIPEAWIQEQQGNPSLESPRGADVFTEPGGAVAEGVQNREGKDDDEEPQEEVLPVIQKLGKFYFWGPDFVEKFLEESKGAEPTAGEPSRQHSDHPEESNDKASHVEAGACQRGPDACEDELKRAERAGERGRRAGVTVETRNTKGLQRALVDLPREDKTQG